jgi:hypothetical protein
MMGARTQCAVYGGCSRPFWPLSVISCSCSCLATRSRGKKPGEGRASSGHSCGRTESTLHGALPSKQPDNGWPKWRLMRMDSSTTELTPRQQQILELIRDGWRVYGHDLKGNSDWCAFDGISKLSRKWPRAQIQRRVLPQYRGKVKPAILG